jgi:hypothetical protein
MSPISPNEIEHQLIDHIAQLAKKANSKFIPKEKLYPMLYELGKMQESYRVSPYGSKCRAIDRTTSEWLYDFSWIDAENYFLFKEIVLAVESENGKAVDVRRDFRKLVQARASHRLLIYRCPTEEILEPCIEQISRFNQSQTGDRYLFIQWAPREIYSTLYVHGSSAMQL